MLTVGGCVYPQQEFSMQSRICKIEARAFSLCSIKQTGLFLATLMLITIGAFAGEALDLETLDGTQYRQVTVTSATALAVTFSYADGVVTIPFAKLTDNSKKLAGYDPQKAADAEATLRAAQQQAIETQKRQADESAKIKAKFQAIRDRLRAAASQRLLMASAEDQLRAAMAARMLQKRKGKPLSADEFQFLSEDSRDAIVLYYPDLMPDELLPTH
jgi:hypothetical protein